MADWTQIHDAVQAAIVTASGLAADHVIWMYEDYDAPQRNYLALRFSSTLTKGQDYLAQDYDGLRPPGQEVRFQTMGVREMTLEITGFSDSTADNNDAQALVDLVKTSLLLPGVRGQFTAVGVSPFDPGPVNYVPEIVNVDFRGRAVCTVRCYVPAPVAQEFAGYIATVMGTVTAAGGVLGPVVTPYTVP